MGSVGNIKVHFTGQNTSELVRELNRRFDSVKDAVNTNFRRGYPQVDAQVKQNGDVNVWVALDEYEIDRWAVFVDNVTPNPTINLRLNGVSLDTQTPSAIQVYEYEIDPVVAVSRLDRVSVQSASLAAGAIITIAIGVRRMT